MAGLALLAGCAPSAVTVTAVAPPALPLAAPFRLAPGSDAQAIAALARHGMTTDEGAAILLTATRSVQRASLGVCATPDATLPGGCAAWRKPPQTGWHPFGTADDHRLVLDFTDIATGQGVYRVEAGLRARRAPADVTARLVDAALACARCVGGRGIAAR